MDQDHISLLKGLIEIFSPTGQEEEAVKYLVAQMNKLGYQSFIDPVGIRYD